MPVAKMQHSDSEPTLSRMRFLHTLDQPLAAGGVKLGRTTLPVSGLVGPCQLGVSMEQIFRFVFPDRLENPDSVGRLAVFANFGPADDDGYLRGGFGGMHKNTDMEVNQMASHSCMETIYNRVFRGKQRSTVDVVARNLHHAAMKMRYDRDQVRALLSGVEEKNGRMAFLDVEKTIRASELRRLMTLRHRAEAGLPLEAPKERPPHVPFQSAPAKELMKVTMQKTLGRQEEDSAHSKRLNSYSSLCGTLEQQNLGEALKANVLLMRNPGTIDDRWDRYCAIRRIGRSSYVGARNNDRFNAAMDEGLSNKHPGASSLLAAHAAGSSAAVQLAS